MNQGWIIFEPPLGGGGILEEIVDEYQISKGFQRKNL